jgi:hypothetical protein
MHFRKFGGNELGPTEILSILFLLDQDPGEPNYLTFAYSVTTTHSRPE